MAPSASTQSKILSLPTLLARCREAREQGRQIVHCHGCFDLVHPGHVRHLDFAARLGDLLLVTISGDSMIDKGTGRPLIPEALRAENLAALNCVDWVYIDPHPTALEVINQVKPDVYLKGREYESNRDPRFLAEREAVESHGGRVVFSSGDIVFSSSALIAALTDNHDPIDRALEQLSEVNDLRPSSLEGILDNFAGKRIVVIGEPIIDRYVYCERPEVASESPVMTLRPIDSQTFDGGAAIICRHIASLGGQAELVTALPERDDAAVLFVERMRAQNIEVRHVESDQSITEKQRFLVGAQKVMKIDLGRPMTIDERGRSEFISLAIDAASQDGGVDGVIFADFGQGLLTPATLDRLIRQLRPLARIMTGDVSGKRASLLRLQQMDLVCPTEDELREAMSDFAEGLGAVVWRWLERTNVNAALVTMGAEGVIAFSRRAAGQPRLAGLPARLKSDHIPGLGPIGIDPLGCGDAMLSTATLALSAGADLVQAGYLGSLAASIESRQLGNVPVGAAGLRSEWQRLAARHLLIASAV